ncbi:MAG: nuclear transport factor 2 family protein [Flavisolibacter sp.]|jgi:hypothetical protein|nr:nuclear transport factor 2 family protein [Flavisolibacter sp.]
MRLVAVILTISLGISLNALAQSDEESVKHVINNLFDGMRNADSASVRQCFHADARLQTVLKNQAVKLRVGEESVNNFVRMIGMPHEKIYDERIKFDMIQIDGDLAVAWTPYSFYIGSDFSHCGVNAFQLVRTEKGWKILSIIDTRRKDNCR